MDASAGSLNVTNRGLLCPGPYQSIKFLGSEPRLQWWRQWLVLPTQELAGVAQGYEPPEDEQPSGVLGRYPGQHLHRKEDVASIMNCYSILLLTNISYVHTA